MGDLAPGASPVETLALIAARMEAAGLAVVEVKEKRGWECIICKKA